MSKLVTVIAVFAAVAAVAVVMIGLSAINRPPTPIQVTEAAYAEQTQVSDVGGVQVRVTLHPVTDIASNTLSFGIVIDTHSVDLSQFDLNRLSKVTLEPGGPLTKLEWQPNGEGGGHHVEGRLIAQAAGKALAAASGIQLDIQGLASLEPRRFEWKVQGK